MEDVPETGSKTKRQLSDDSDASPSKKERFSENQPTEVHRGGHGDGNPSAREVLARLKAKREQAKLKTSLQPSIPDTPEKMLTQRSSQQSISQSKAATDLERVNRQIVRLGQILNNLEIGLTSHAFLNDLPRVQDWRQKLEELEKELKLPETVIAVVGNTGSGKSSLINALLDDELGVLPTSAMRACTAVVVEVVNNQENSLYEAEIIFLSRKEWEDELRLLVEETGVDGDPGDAKNTLQAVYGELKEFIFEELIKMKHVTKWLGGVITIASEDLKDFQKKVEPYIEASDAFGGQYWPIVKQARLRLPRCDVCSSGAVLVDLPGGRDSNAARNKIANEYLKKCSAVWVISDIHRAVDDKTAKDLLGVNFRRQMLMDGQYGRMAFICTKSDDIPKASELIRSLEIKECQPFEKEMRDVNVQKEKLESSVRLLSKDIRHLTKEIAKLEDEINELQGDLLEADTALDSEATDVGVEDQRVLEELKEDLAKKKLELNEKNMTISKKEKEQGETNKKILELKQTIDVLTKKIASICAKARNEYSKERIKKDFKAGLMEMKNMKRKPRTDEHVEEEGNSSYHDDEDTTLGISTDNLKVFCVSATEYQKMKNHLTEDGPPQVFSTKEETQIPALREFVHDTAAYPRVHRTEQLIQSIGHLVFEMEGYVSDKGTESDRIRSSAKSALETNIQKLKKNFSPVLDELRSDLKETFMNYIHVPLMEGVGFAEQDALNISTTWGMKANKSYRHLGGYNWNTYNCVVRRKGIFVSKTYQAYGPINFNRQLADPILDNISVSWGEVFRSKSGKLAEIENKCISDIHEKLMLFTDELGQELARVGVPQDRIQRVASRVLHGASIKISNSMEQQEEPLKEKQAEISRVITPAIQERMLDTYEKCSKESGTGKFKNMKAIMEEHITVLKTFMFEDAAGIMWKDLIQLQKDIVDTVHPLCEVLCQDVQVAYEPLCEAPENSRKLYEAIWDCIKSNSNEIRQLYKEANLGNVEGSNGTGVDPTVPVAGSSQVGSDPRGSGKQCTDPVELSKVLHESSLSFQREREVGERLRRNCDAAGLQFRGTTPSNGNCFFEALSSQLNRLGLPQKSPQELRAAGTQFLLDQRTFQGQDGIFGVEDFLEVTLDDYCRRMGRDGEYADHVIIFAMARLLERDIVIVTSSPDAGPDSTITWIVGRENFRGDPLLLGHYWENHYQSLEPKGKEVPSAAGTSSQIPASSVPTEVRSTPDDVSDTPSHIKQEPEAMS